MAKQKSTDSTKVQLTGGEVATLCEAAKPTNEKDQALVDVLRKGVAGLPAARVVTCNAADVDRLKSLAGAKEAKAKPAA